MFGRTILCCVIASLTSCSHSENPSSIVTSDTATASQDGSNNSIYSITVGAIPKKSAPCDFGNASITGDHLRLEVEYSGGCEEHLFEIYWSGHVLEEDPVSVELVVVHDDRNDACEKAVSEAITIDLSQIKSACMNIYSEEIVQEIGITVTNLQGKRCPVAYSL